MSTLFMILVSLSVMFLWLNHPLSMGLILICQTIIISLITGMMLSSFLFSYIIVIIMLSGALVLFIYMASVASNEKFQTPVKLIKVFFISMTFLFFLNENLNFMQNSNDNFIILKPEMMSLLKLFNSTSAYITLMMIVYLLLTMVVVSNIATISEGPLRMKM
uniref:NADH-ubiquinone oxidoreductase chain 6 n=1 Tax=Coleoptera sp. 3 KM-2017 TaxID=2219334 RepID=A0A346RI01_9COLE|nr:NADH dehydrogenase subunit 6 [Coleoptera sp. 3 KM-2017]